MQIGKLDSSIEQAKRLAAATERANRNSIEAERPWLGMVLDVSEFKKDEVPTAKLIVTNSGRRPALVNLSALQPHFFVDALPDDPPYAIDIKKGSKNFIVPGSSLGLKIKVFKEKLTDETFTFLNKSGQTLFIYAKVEYSDPRDGSLHFTHACWRYSLATEEVEAGFVNCTEYNEAN